MVIASMLALGYVEYRNLWRVIYKLTGGAVRCRKLGGCGGGVYPFKLARLRMANRAASSIQLRNSNVGRVLAAGWTIQPLGLGSLYWHVSPCTAAVCCLCRRIAVAVGVDARRALGTALNSLQGHFSGLGKCGE